MVRAVLLGVLAVSAASCSSHGGAAQVDPGAAAGKVLEVTGKVSLHHGTQVRPLAAGDRVAGDDVIETGADGHAVIELSHNLARWELGPNKREQVSASLAWNLPRADHPAKAVEQDTSAAGRQGERSAAETTSTVGGLAPPEAQPAAPPEAERAAAPAVIAAGPAPAAGAPGGGSRGASNAPAPPPPPPPARERRAAAAPEKAEAPALKQDRADDALAAPQLESAKKGKAPGGVAANDALAHLLETHQHAFAACLVGHTRALSITLVVGASGKVTTQVDGDAAAKRCVAKVVAHLHLPHGPARASLTISR